MQETEIKEPELNPNIPPNAYLDTEQGITIRCKRCKRHYDNLDAAATCAVICKMTEPLEVMLFRAHTDRFNGTQKTLVDLFKCFQESNGYETCPIDIMRHTAGLQIFLNPEKNISENLFEKLTWEHLYGYMETGMISPLAEGFIISMHFADTFIDTFDKFMSPTQKVSLPRPLENVEIDLGVGEEEVTG
jgi:hypothetical protein